MPLKEKEKKAFGPGARDYKPMKPSDQRQSQGQQLIQVEKQHARGDVLRSEVKRDDIPIGSNNQLIKADGGSGGIRNRNDKAALLNQWSNALRQEEPPHRDNNSMILIENHNYHVDKNNAHAVGSGGIGGGGYLLEFNKKREGQRQRSNSNPRGGRMRVDPSYQYGDDNSTVYSDGRLISHRQKEQQQQQKQLVMEETLSLPTILPNRQLKSSHNHTDYCSEQGPKSVFSMNSDKGRNGAASNRNATMSAPPKMMDAPPSTVPALVLPSIKKSLINGADQQAHDTPLLVHPSRNRRG